MTNLEVKIMAKFKKDTELFLKQVIESHLNTHIDSYIKKYYEKDSDTFTGWEKLLKSVMEELQYQLEIGQGQDQTYPYKIKLITHFVKVKERCIKILIIDSETAHVLKTDILMVRYGMTIIAYIYVKGGFIIFEPEE